MAEHEPSIGGSDDWYTPSEIFDAMRLTFDLDPCSPGADHWVPARKVYTKADDGLSREWRGLVFMNPPFGGRHGHIPWLRKFLNHGNGIAIVRAYTSSDWWHDLVWPRAETILFPAGKTKFIPSEALRAKLTAEIRTRTGNPRAIWRDAPGHGIALIGMGALANSVLFGCRRLGHCIHERGKRFETEGA